MNPSEQIAFDMFLASISSMQFHPGAGTKEHKVLSPKECGEQAMKLILVRREYYTQLHGGG